VFARREFLGVTREAELQDIESLADIPPLALPGDDNFLFREGLENL
jgi:hypothetical protein